MRVNFSFLRPKVVSCQAVPTFGPKCVSFSLWPQRSCSSADFVTVVVKLCNVVWCHLDSLCCVAVTSLRVKVSQGWGSPADTSCGDDSQLLLRRPGTPANMGNCESMFSLTHNTQETAVLHGFDALQYFGRRTREYLSKFQWGISSCQDLMAVILFWERAEKICLLLIPRMFQHVRSDQPRGEMI